MLEGALLPNFYKPSLITNPVPPIKGDDQKKFPLPLVGKFYTPQEIKERQIEGAAITKIYYPPEGGIETHLQYYQYPFKGTPNAQIVYIMALIKGVIPVGADFLSVIVKNPFLLFSIKKAINKTVPKMLGYAHKLLQEFLPENPRLYSKPVREVFRIFTPETMGATGDLPSRDIYNRENVLTWMEFRDLFCMTLEFDNAYRFPFQDVVRELDVRQFVKHPIRESRRLFDLMIERQVFPHLADKYKKLKLLSTVLMIISPAIKKKVVEIVSRIDITQIKPDEGDLYFMATRTDFNYNSLNPQVKVACG